MTYKFNDFETDIDNTDVDFIEKYAAELQKLYAASEKMKKMDNAAEIFKTGCEAVDGLFNSLFGDGTAKKIFGSGRSYKERLKAMIELRRAVDDASEINELNAEIEALMVTE